MIFSPLEQFAINCLIPFRIGGFDFSFTNSSLFMIVGTGLVSLLIWFATVNGGKLIPSRWQSIVEMVYDFVYDMVQNQVGPAGRPYFPFIFTLFVFLLGANLIGMIPYSFTSTSHIVVTFGLSLSIFVGVTLLGILRHGLHFLSFFLPAGAPLALAPLLVVLEVVFLFFQSY
jgi:ATP synthase subunit 6